MFVIVRHCSSKVVNALLEYINFALSEVTRRMGPRKVPPFCRKGTTFLGVCSHLSPAYFTPTREIINIIVSLIYLFTFLLLIYGTFKHSHDD